LDCQVHNAGTVATWHLLRRGRATRERIIAGAAEYLRSDIPGEATLDDIRAITGTSKSQIFHYFPAGKEELLLEAARYESQRVLDDQQPHLGSLTSWAAWIAGETPSWPVTGHKDGTARLPRSWPGSAEAAFVHGAVLDIDGGRVNVLTSADAAAVRRPDPAS
jgi:AcrR family transcriptional regulator